MGESSIEDALSDLMDSANPTLAPYAGEGECFLRVTARGKDDAEALALTQPMVDKVCGILGSVVYGVDVGTLEEAAVSLLVRHGLTLAVAESCTGGWVQQRITNVPGVSACFLGGVCAYSAELKTALLDVPRAVIDTHGAVSAETAAAMAAGVRLKTGADIAVAVTGLAGPDGDGSDTAVGTVFIALAAEGAGLTKRLHLGDDRRRIRMMASGHALDMIRRHLTNAIIDT
jgi:nicotinamide-nucleotide amidase